MPKFEWKVRAVLEQDNLVSFAQEMEKKLNELEKEGFEVQKLEVKRRGVLLTGRRPARPQKAA